jgi:hypothetical protein
MNSKTYLHITLFLLLVSFLAIGCGGPSAYPQPCATFVGDMQTSQPSSNATAKEPARPLLIENGVFELNLSDTKIVDHFTSPTEAKGTMELCTKESSGLGNRVECEFGSWGWTAQSISKGMKCKLTTTINS